MEDFLRAINDYNNAISGKEAELALKKCRELFADLVQLYAPSQSYGNLE